MTFWNVISGWIWCKLQAAELSINHSAHEEVTSLESTWKITRPSVKGSARGRCLHGSLSILQFWSMKMLRRPGIFFLVRCFWHVLNWAKSDFIPWPTQLPSAFEEPKDRNVNTTLKCNENLKTCEKEHKNENTKHYILTFHVILIKATLGTLFFFWLRVRALAQRCSKGWPFTDLFQGQAPIFSAPLPVKPVGTKARSRCVVTIWATGSLIPEIWKEHISYAICIHMICKYVSV